MAGHDDKMPMNTSGSSVDEKAPELVDSRPVSTIVDFAPNDSEDPLNWSSSYKWVVMVLVTLLSALVYLILIPQDVDKRLANPMSRSQLGIVIAAPAAPQIQRELGASSSLYSTLLVTIWELGEVVGPLLYGPLCERLGRLPVIHATSLLLVLFCIGSALSPNIGTLLAMRFLAGASVAVTSIAGGIVRDLFTANDRGPALSLMMIGSQVGPALGPIVGSFLAESAGWRWIFWLCAILAGAVGGLFAVVYRETYPPVILARRAAVLRRETGDVTLISKYGEQQQSLRSWRGIWQRVFRPVYLLTQSWALAVVTVFISIFLGLQYLALTSVAPVFQDVYAFSEGQSGLAYLGLYIGMMVGCAYFNLSKHLAKRRANAGPQSSSTTLSKHPTPETNLFPALPAALLMAAGFLLFGWSSRYHTHWIVPILGTSMIGGSYFIATTSVRAYIVDAFGVWAVSASAGMFAVRNAVAAGLPLVGPPLFQRLELGWGASVLALIALSIAPVPWLMARAKEGTGRRRLRILE